MSSERKNGAAAGPTLTLGAVATRLRENGYEPVSAISPDGRWLNAVPPRFEPFPPHVVSQHQAAVAVRGALVVLVLAPALLKDQVPEERVRQILEKRGLSRGPVRIGSDGSEARPIRLSVPCQSQEALNGAVSVDQALNAMTHIIPSCLPLDGSWPQGTLLDVPLKNLPEISADALTETFAELRQLPQVISAERRPPPKPSKRAFLGAP